MTHQPINTHPEAAPSHGAGVTEGFIRPFGLALAGLAALLVSFILVLDPYGVSPLNRGRPRPIMDINQRYMYPQVIRSGRFDSAVIGTSTSRLLDPAALDKAFGGRFANLAMNAATAWEQEQVGLLFLRNTPRVGTMLIGTDAMWCLEGNNLPRITERGFPEWMYDDYPLNDLPQVFNLKTLEIAGRLAGHHLGLMPVRMRSDGFDVFTPPEESYDAARARFHLWQGFPQQRITPVVPPAHLTETERTAISLSALPRLESLLIATPRTARRIVVHMPVHIAALPAPGSRGALVLDECKRRIGAIAASYGATFIDFAIPSEITTKDENYWDPLHYRLPIAQRIIDGVASVLAGGRDAPDGSYRVR